MTSQRSGHFEQSPQSLQRGPIAEAQLATVEVRFATLSDRLHPASGVRTFYAELSDTYSPTACSDFCRAEVLPHLRHGDSVRSLEQLRAQLWSWLVAEGESTVLVCDSARDVVQLENLFSSGLPQNCRYEVLGFWGNMKRRVLNAGKRLHKQHGLRPHHALDDALVNRMVLARR